MGSGEHSRLEGRLHGLAAGMQESPLTYQGTVTSPRVLQTIAVLWILIVGGPHPSHRIHNTSATGPHGHAIVPQRYCNRRVPTAAARRGWNPASAGTTGR